MVTPSDVWLVATADRPAPGARLLVADRRDPNVYEQALQQSWDAVVEVSWHPGFVRAALAALAGCSSPAPA